MAGVGFVFRRDTKHIDGEEYTNTSLYDLYRHESTRDLFLKHISEQSKDRFKGVNYLISFLGEEGRNSRFLSVHKVISSQEFPERDHARFVYQLEEVEGFDGLKERIIIDWGKSTISWHQWMDNENPKSIVEISAPINQTQFKNYEDFILDRSQLEFIFKGTSKNCFFFVTLNR